MRTPRPRRHRPWGTCSGTAGTGFSSSYVSHRALTELENTSGTELNQACQRRWDRKVKVTNEKQDTREIRTEIKPFFKKKTQSVPIKRKSHWSYLNLLISRPLCSSIGTVDLDELPNSNPPLRAISKLPPLGRLSWSPQSELLPSLWSWYPPSTLSLTSYLSLPSLSSADSDHGLLEDVNCFSYYLCLSSVYLVPNSVSGQQEVLNKCLVIMPSVAFTCGFH